MNIIYSNKHYNVYSAGNEFIIHNTHKPWKDEKSGDYGHTHVEHKKTAIWLCNLAAYKRFPKTNCLYFYISLIRLSDDPVYTKKLQELYDIKLAKSKNKNYYININKHGKN